MGTTCLDASKLYATDSAPYLQYLNSVREDWQEAEVLSKHLTLAATLIPTGSDEYFLQGGRLAVAQILDISVSTDERGNDTYGTANTFTLRKRLDRPPTDKVEEFLQHLRSCEPNVDTRVVVLHREWSFPPDDNGASKAADTLLFCHILGMELDLRPSDVSILARIVDFEGKVESFRRRPQRAGYVSFGSLHRFHYNSVAASLGVRKFQAGSANLVVMCLHERRSPWAGSAYPRSDEPLQPLLPSSWASEGSRSVTRIPSTSKIFARALKCSLGTIPVSKDDALDGHWLAALIHLETINCAAWLDYVDALRSSVRNHVSKEQQQLSEEISNLCKTLQSDVSQLVAFSRTPSVKIRFSDYEEQLLMLERLLGEAKVIATEIRESLDMQHRIKSTQVAELAINESRSAIAVTVLAFVFIPINLASSIYGMNVQEINETGHSIWGFLVTASVLLTMSGLAWMGWRASRNWGVILDDARQAHLAFPGTYHETLGNLYWRMREASERFKMCDFAVYIGLRSVEKRKQSAVGV